MRMKNITARTFHAAAWKFMEKQSGLTAKEAQHGGWGIMIDPNTDPMNWKAWKSYFQRKRIPYGLMTKIENGFEAKYMVPTELPSDFDAE